MGNFGNMDSLAKVKARFTILPSVRQAPQNHDDSRRRMTIEAIGVEVFGVVRKLKAQGTANIF